MNGLSIRLKTKTCIHKAANPKIVPRINTVLEKTIAMMPKSAAMNSPGGVTFSGDVEKRREFIEELVFIRETVTDGIWRRALEALSRRIGAHLPGACGKDRGCAKGFQSPSPYSHQSIPAPVPHGQIPERKRPSGCFQTVLW
jgi:hypothetical protein